MASIDEINRRVEALSQRHQNVSERRAKLVGKLDEKKAELLELRKEIEGAGFDPKNLKGEKEKLEKELEHLIDTFETELTRVEEAVAEYEK